jgi:hypothetical protein
MQLFSYLLSMYKIIIINIWFECVHAFCIVDRENNNNRTVSSCIENDDDDIRENWKVHNLPLYFSVNIEKRA